MKSNTFLVPYYGSRPRALSEARGTNKWRGISEQCNAAAPTHNITNDGCMYHRLVGPIGGGTGTCSTERIQGACVGEHGAFL